MSSKESIQDALIRRAAEEKWNVSELTSALSRETGYSRDAVVEELIRLSEGNRLFLTEKSPYQSIARYASSPYSLWFWAAVVATSLSVVLTTVSPGLLIYLRYVLGSALILFLPGFSLVELLYADRKELDAPERFALAVGLSLALTALSGLALNYTPLGLGFIPALATLAGLTIVLLLLAMARKYAHYRSTKEAI